MDLSRRLGAEFIGTAFLLATVVGYEKRVAFETAYDALRAGIGMFLNLTLDTNDEAALRRQLNEIGQSLPKSA